MNDPVLLRELAAEFERHDPVPTQVRVAAEWAGSLVSQAKSWSTLKLVTGAGLRGDGLLGFAGPAGRVDLEIESGDGAVTLSGLATRGDVWVRWPGGERHAVVDDVGRFTVVGLPAGPLSVVVRRQGEPDAVGPWFVG